MMARPTGRYKDAADQQGNWLGSLIAYWPLILATLTVIAFILNAQRDIADLKNQTVVNGSRILAMGQRTDSLAQSAVIRDFMICKVFETLLKKDSTAARLPKHCDDVFQSMGYR